MKRFFAIDIGGTSAKYALVDEDGVLSRRGSFETGIDITPDRLADELCRAVESVADVEIAGVGVSCLGWVDSTTGRFCGGAENLPALNSLCIPELLRRRFDVPVAMHNDVDSMALGELRFGAGRGCADFMCVALGTGIGGAIVLDGRLWTGAHHRAGELGYLGWTADGECLERRTSALGMVSEAARAVQMPEMDGRDFFALVRQGNDVCVRILHKHMALLGAALANMLIVLDVEKVIIGGGISSQGDILLPALQAGIDARLPEAMHGQYALVAAQRGNDAALLGAVSGL